jgi:opacity protein-like surface antigen
MKKIFCVFVVVLAFALVAAAQEASRFETFVGYTYLRANSATTVPAFSANGGAGQFVVNANHWLGFVMDMGAVHNGNISDLHIDTTVVNYLFGPRLSVRYSRITPFIQTLWGGAHVGNSIAVKAIPVAGNPIYLPGEPTVPANSPITFRNVASQTAFSMTAGGGLDIKINKNVSFRPIQLEYYLTRFQNYRSANDNNQNNIRYMTGFNFTFGAQ